MNKHAMMELEPYEAPVLEDLKLSVLRGEAEGQSNPSGIPDPGNDPNPDDDEW